MKKNIIYYGECEHLDGNLLSDSCLKRYISFYNINTNVYDTIGICSKYLSLLINNRYYESGKWYYKKSDAFADVIRDILTSFIPDELKVNNSKNRETFFNSNSKESKDILKVFIKIELSIKPYTFYSVNIIDAINYDLNNNDYRFRNQIFLELRQFLDFRKEKMYKSKYKEIITLLNKYQDYYSNEQRVLIMNEIFINILKLKDHETSKQ